ncbi:hypothetical protein TRFO_24661 [Tritrichomonas foetus]|uniref:Protein kinase domain-containing protein n=1 Tax=Tritrichomonas foetus TaxID=1144522 RepID=A0A1J4KCS5_9EUKA|nr:hypothetical protein TRFO_24661 [Tritrichomonas foetus]|eukprot:OHT07253.1 hypothetical protein TRFO_24661 [Tritrichomonas foetus]
MTSKLHADDITHEIKNNIIKFTEKDKSLEKMYDQFNFLEISIIHYNEIPQEEFQLFLLKSPFITIGCQDKNNFLMHAICVESKCYLIKESKHNESSNSQVISLVKNIVFDLDKPIYPSDDFTYRFFMNEEFHKYILYDAETYYNHIRMKMKNLNLLEGWENNIFIESTIRPLFVFLTQRFYFKTKSFQDSSFFNLPSQLTIQDSNKIHDSSSLYTVQAENKESPKFLLLHQLGKGSKSEVYFAIHLDSFAVVALKKVIFNNKYTPKHFEREKNIFRKIQSNHFVKCFGQYLFDKSTYLILEFMSEGSLKDNESILSKNNQEYSTLKRLRGLLGLIKGIKRLHMKEYLHRDINATNILINHDHHFYISDFESAREIGDDMSVDVANYDSMSPEMMINNNVSYPTDIFSFATLISLFFPDSEQIHDLVMICSIQKQCLDVNPNNRLPIRLIELLIYYQIFQFYIDNKYCNDYKSKSDIITNNRRLAKLILKINGRKKLGKTINYCSQVTWEHLGVAYLKIGALFYENDLIPLNISKTMRFYEISSDLNQCEAQFYLGLLYLKGEFIPQDIKKAIQYFELSSNNNYVKAQYNLGVLYEMNEYIPRDIKKAIHYYELAANQNHIESQFNLGVIYEMGEFIPLNTPNTVYYSDFASNNNNYGSQLVSKPFYKKGEFVPENLQQAIHFLEIASNQKNFSSQIPTEKLSNPNHFVPQDIEKAIHYYEHAANQNHLLAQIKLGTLYEKGELIPQNIHKAIHYYELAAKQNSGIALNNLGIIYEKGEFVPQDISKAINYYELAVRQNYLPAQVNLGNLYLQGTLLPKDISKAVFYTERASNQNFVTAHYNLGLLYEKGETVPRDINKALYYYELAAKQNDYNAQYNLGVLYYKGELIAKDIKKAIYYLELAANLNFPEAQYQLGLIYMDDHSIVPDMKKSVHYLELASLQNHCNAQYKLGVLYYIGRLIPRDVQKGIQYFELAASQNHSDSQCVLGLIYLNGECVQKNISKAIHYFVQSAEKNNPQALFNLGVIYMTGDIIPSDGEKAIRYFEQASKQNSVKALYNLGLIYENGELVEQDIQKSIHYYELAAKQNDPESQYSLGLFYMYGEYVTQNIEKATHYFELAANQNHILAQKKLVILTQNMNLISQHTPHTRSNDIKKSIQENDFSVEIVKSEVYDKTRNEDKKLSSQDNHSSENENLQKEFYEGYTLQ